MTKEKFNESNFDLTLYGLTNDAFEKLDKLEKGIETEELKIHLPESLLKAGLRVYRIMTILDQPGYISIRSDQMKRASMILGYSFDHLSSIIDANAKTKILRRIELGKLLDHDLQNQEPLIKIFRLTKKGLEKLNSSGKKILYKEIYENPGEYYVYFPVNKKRIEEAAEELNIDIAELIEIIASDPSRVIYSYQLKTKEANHRIHGLMQNPLNILVFFIRHHLRRIKLKSINGRTLRFLEEQKIIDEGDLEESSISKRANYKRIENYENIYNVYRSAFWCLKTHSPDSINRALQKAKEKNRFFSDRGDNYYDLLFPEWHHIILK